MKRSKIINGVRVECTCALRPPRKGDVSECAADCAISRAERARPSTALATPGSWSPSWPPNMKKATTDLEIELCVRAYGQGFVAGVRAVQDGTNARHTVDVATHEHWKQGYEDGRKALDIAAAHHRSRLERDRRKYCGHLLTEKCTCGPAPF